MSEKLITVSEAVLQLPPSRPCAHMHPINDYALALADFPLRARRYAGDGSECVVVELEDGNILKISRKALSEEMGKRVRDCPVLEQGSKVVNGRTYYWHIQPKCEMLGEYHWRLVHELLTELRSHGLRLIENHNGNFGLLNGRLVVVDLFSVAPSFAPGEEREGMEF
jgi:hypothetical protein